MSTNLLWGTKSPAVVLTGDAFNLKRMYRVKFTNGGIDSTYSGPEGDAESGGMYIYIICKTFLSNEAITITYTGIDDVQRTIPSSGSISLAGKRSGDIIRVVNEVSLGMDSFVKAKSVDSIQRISGGIQSQELEIWGIDLDVSLIGLPMPVPYHPQFRRVDKRNTLISGKIDSKILGFKIFATLTYQWLENYDAKKFVEIYNHLGNFYFIPHFENAPNLKYLVIWSNDWDFRFWKDKKKRWENPSIEFEGVNLIAKLPKPIEDVVDHTGFWSHKHARTDNDDARFWDGEEPYIRGDQIWTPKKAFQLKHTGSGTKAELFISRTHLATFIDDVLDVFIEFNNASYDSIAEAVTYLDGLSDYECNANINETDFDGTTEKHYDGTQPSSKLIAVDGGNIKGVFYQVYW